MDVNILEICKELGSPQYFMYHHGLIINAQTDSVTLGKQGNIILSLKGERLINLHPDYIEYIQPRLNRPDMYMADFEKCLMLKQKETGEVLGWLCWK